MKFINLYFVLFIGFSLFFTACDKQKKERVQYQNGMKYAPIYNDEVTEWLQKEYNNAQRDFDELKDKLNQTPDSKSLKDAYADAERQLEKIETRLTRGDYFQFKKASELPVGLKWTSGDVQPEIGDVKAKKGGVFTDYITSFPSTLRPFGTESNSGLRSKLYDEINLGLISIHPITSKSFPSLAKEWAIDETSATVYYRLNPKATFSNGDKVTVSDYITAIYIRVSPFVKDLYAKQYYREQIAGVTVYGDDIIAVTLPELSPRIEQSANLAPASSRFYNNYGPDYEQFYQWKVPPSTGAYYVKDEDIIKGQSVTLTRNKNWWAKDLRYYQYRFNADKIKYLVVRDTTKAYELFRIGMLDFYSFSDPEYWFEKSEIAPVFNGYIEKYKFYNQYPRVPRGIYMNVTRPLLNDKNIRTGIQHSMNWQKVIDVYYRGEFARLQRFHEGYGEFSNGNIKAREYSADKAKQYFAKAGFNTLNNEGILVNSTGEKLSVSISYSKSPKLGNIMSMLKEEAKKIGLEIRLDDLERTVSYQKVMRKEHDMTYWGWGSSPPFPVFYQFFHSSNAVDEKGKAKPSTNNINCYSSIQMDKYCIATRNARTEEEYKDAALKAQQLIFEEAFFVPAFSVNFYAVGSWRWLKWPDENSTTPFNAPISDEALSSYVWWIDSSVKAETLEAKRSGKKFPEVQKVIDLYKDGIK